MAEVLALSDIIDPVSDQNHQIESEQSVQSVFDSRYELVQFFGSGLEVIHEPNTSEQESIRALEQLDDLLDRKKLSRSEVETMRGLMKKVGNELWVEQGIDLSKIEKYFTFLEGLSSDKSYAFLAPIIKRELTGYICYEMAHDDVDYTDQSALEYIFEPISFINANILTSRLRENPALWLDIMENPKYYNKTPDSLIFKFMHRIKSMEHMGNACQALDYLLFNRDRLSIIMTCRDQARQQAFLLVEKGLKKIRKLDTRYFQDYFKGKI